ncbi:MAG: hypothetical protein RL641_694 [Candidatus Parcubacteria bacterium]
MVFLALLVTYKIALPAAEDLPRQMKNGQEILQGNFANLTQNVYSFTDPTHYFANHHWLYGVLAYLSYQVVGWSGMVIFKVLFVLLIFALLFKTALRRANFWLVAICSIPFLLFLSVRSGLRPELFGYFFIALYFYLLGRLEENPKSSLIYWLIPAQLLWANLHITFPIGVMIVGGFLLEKIILNRKHFWKNVVIKKLIILLVVLSAVSFANPNGIKGAIYSLESNTAKGGTIVSAEVQPLRTVDNDTPSSSTDPAHLFIYLLPIAALSFIVSYRKKPILYFVATLGTALITFKIFRSFPFFGMMFLLAVPANFDNLFLRLKKFLKTKWAFVKISFETAAATLIIIGLIFTTQAFYKKTIGGGIQPGIGLTPTSESSARFFLDNNLKGPIFNDTDVGSYLIWYLYPQEKVFADNRFGDAYSESFWKDEYLAAMTNEQKWKEVSEKYNFNTIFIDQYDKGSGIRDFVFNRIHDPAWVFVYGDDYNVILVRNTIENKEVIDKYAINFDNSYDRFRHLAESMNARDQVTAGDLFGLMGEVIYTRAAFERAVALDPNMAKIWFILGKTELQRNDQANADTSLALLFINQAIERGWKTVNAYSFQALAYYRLGQMDKAKESVRKELKLNPKSEDAKTWLTTFKKDDAAKLLKNE